MIAERQTLTVEEAGRILGISRSTAFEAVKTGQLPHVRIGRRILVPMAALAKMLQGNSIAKDAEDGMPTS